MAVVILGFGLLFAVPIVAAWVNYARRRVADGVFVPAPFRQPKQTIGEMGKSTAEEK